MKFSFTVDSAREASYVMSMFGALHAAMVDQPPPVILSRTETNSVGDCSQSVTTEVTDKEPMPEPHPFNGLTAAPAGIADAWGGGGGSRAVHLHSISTTSSLIPIADDVSLIEAREMAERNEPLPEQFYIDQNAEVQLKSEPTGKKRGRKSNAEKEAEAAAKKALEENALRPGDALKGVDAQSLAQALEGMPLVFEGGGVQMRVEPGTSEAEISEIRARLTAVDKTPEDRAAQTQDKIEQLFNPPKVIETPAPVAHVMDDDMEALFRKKLTPPQESTPPVSKFAHLSGEPLMHEFKMHINAVGIFWARRVMAHYGLEVLGDMTDEHVRFALDNPDTWPKTEAG